MRGVSADTLDAPPLEPGAATTVTERSVYAAAARAVRRLLAAEAFPRALDRVLEELGSATGSRCAVLLQMPALPAGPPRQAAVAGEWHEAGFLAPLLPTGGRGLCPIEGLMPPADDEVSVLPMQAGRSAFDDGQLALGIHSMLAVAVTVEGRPWGLLTLGSSDRWRIWTPASIQALRSVALGLGATLARDEARVPRGLERLALLEDLARPVRAEHEAAEGAERARRLARVQAGLVRAARAIDEDIPLPQALQQCLALLGDALDADSATLGDLAPLDPGRSAARWNAQWHRPGRAEPLAGAPPSRDFDDALARVRRGETVFALDSDLQDPVSREWWRVTDCKARLLVAVALGRGPMAWLGFDWAAPVRVEAPMVAALESAASALGCKVALRYEREVRLAAESRRADEAQRLAAVQAGLIEAGRALNGPFSLEQGLEGYLARVGQALGADAVGLGPIAPGGPGRAAKAAYHAYWHREGLALPAAQVPATEDFDAWIECLLRGEVVFANMADLVDPVSREHWRAGGCASNLMVPLRSGGQTRGFLFLNWSAPQVRAPAIEAALLAVAETLAAQVELHRERERRWAAEARRADEAEAALRALQWRDELLHGVAQASRCLMDAPDLRLGLAAALAHIGQAARQDRAYVLELVDGGTAWGLAAAWHAPGAAPLPAMEPPVRHPVADNPELWRAMSRHQVYIARPGQHSGSPAKPIQNGQIVRDVQVPVVVRGRLWGRIGLDDWRGGQPFDDATLAALRSASEALAAAIGRHQAEAARQAAESARLAQAEADNQRLRWREALLGGVAHAARAMVACTDLRAGLHEAVGLLGAASGRDRAYVFEVVDGGDTLQLAAEWHAPSVGSIAQLWGSRRFSAADYDEVLAPLREGRPYQAFPEQRRGSNQVLNDTIGSLSDAMVPVLLEGQLWGVLGLDDCKAAVAYDAAEIHALEGAAQAVAAAVQRTRATAARLQAEQARVAQAVADNVRLRHREGLLEAVAAASQQLLARSDPMADLEGLLGLIGEAAGALRVAVALLHWTPQDVRAYGEQEICAEWAAPGVVRQTGGPSRRFTMQRDDFWRRAWELLARQRRLVVPIAEAEEPFRSEQAALGVALSLCCPIEIDGRLVALLGIDFATVPAGEGAVDLPALQAVATSIALALQRQAEARRSLESERHRGDDNLRIVGLLTELVRSTSKLIEAPARDFEGQLRTWMGTLALQMGARRATFHDATTHGATGRPTARRLCEWAAPGGAGSAPCSFAEPHVIDPRGAEDEMAALVQGTGVVTLHADQVGAAMRECLMQRGSQTVVCASLNPQRPGGGRWRSVSFDFAERTVPEGPVEAVLKTAAGMLTAVLARLEAESLLEREREERIAAESERAETLARANAAMRRVADSMVEVSLDSELDPRDPRPNGPSGSLQSLFAAVLREVTEPNGASGSAMMVVDAQAQTAQLQVALEGRVVCDVLTDERLASWRPAFPVGHILAALQGAEALIVDTRDPTLTGAWAPGLAWQRERGHERVVYMPLLVAGQVTAVLQLMYRDAAALARLDLDCTRALAHMAALGLEQSRLARSARDALQASERERAERLRLADLARGSEALRSAATALFESQDPVAFVRQGASQLRAFAEASRLYAFRTDSRGLLRLEVALSEDAVSPAGFEGDPPHFATGFVLSENLLHTGTPGAPLWIDLLEPGGAGFIKAETLEWHRRHGHRAVLLMPLMVGRHLSGFIGMVFQHRRRIDERTLELVRLIGQPLAAAFELLRLSRLAQRNAAEAAAMSERARIARDIHDGIAQTFLAIQMQLDVPGEREALAAAGRASSLAQHGLREARRAVAALRPHPLGEQALPDALRRLVASMEASARRSIQLHLPPTWQRLHLELEEQLFRIAQEALQNALKHAGECELRVELVQAMGETSVLVADTGRGFSVPREDAARTGFGLESMVQRAALVGADLQVHSKPGGGTQVLVSVASDGQAVDVRPAADP